MIPTHAIEPVRLPFAEPAQVTHSLTFVSKVFSDIPFAHRQPKHKGHCSLIHGHNWSFMFEFGLAEGGETDENGFIVDFGDLKWIRSWLHETFDHALVLCEGDPAIEACKPFARIIVLENGSAESIARFVGLWVAAELERRYTHVRLARVVVDEDSRNSAVYIPYYHG